jgi:hypothetical protein
MNVQPRSQMDDATFLEWVQGREGRYELDRGRVIMMTGGSRAHWQIAFNLAKALDVRLDRNKWAVLPEFGVDLAPESVRFPDVIVDGAGEASQDLTATAPGGDGLPCRGDWTNPSGAQVIPAARGGAE